MKVHKLFIYLLIAASFLLITACGGGGGDSAGSGELAIDITDAKPMLPTGVTNFFVTFTDVLAHRSGGGGWESLPMPQETYTIDLLQFHSGETTELVPPVILNSGKYTQIRLVVSEAKLIIVDDNDVTTEILVEIPSENLKTDKNFDFDVETDRAADILIDFDLSQSLVVTGPSGSPSYKLKPVLHIVSASEAATITGAITDQSFTNFNTTTANITVWANDEIYTEVIVERNQDIGLSAEFTIFWLVPYKDYRVEIDFDYDPESPPNEPEWCEDVNNIDPAVDFVLNGVDGPITPPFLVCP